MPVNHYRTLGIEPDADQAAIRRAYLALIREMHPDKSASPDAALRTQQLTAAYEVLRDPERRAEHDRQVGGLLLTDFPPRPTGRQVRGGRIAPLVVAVLMVATGWLGHRVMQRPFVPAASPARVEAERPTLTEPVLQPAKPRQLVVAEAPVRKAAVRDQPAKKVEAAAVIRKDGIVPRTTSAPRGDHLAPQVDLASLERELRSLTDRSMQQSDGRRRELLFGSRTHFLGDLATCEDDRCRRNAYLRRKAEIGEIMARD